MITKFNRAKQRAQTFSAYIARGPTQKGSAPLGLNRHIRCPDSIMAYWPARNLIIGTTGATTAFDLSGLRIISEIPSGGTSGALLPYTSTTWFVSCFQLSSSINTPYHMFGNILGTWSHIWLSIGIGRIFSSTFKFISTPLRIEQSFAPIKTYNR